MRVPTPPPGDPGAPLAIRGLVSDDLDWVVQRHAQLYAHEYGFDSSFEALVADIVAQYQARHQPGLENAWIATVGGVRAGCVFCCQKDAQTAQLRLLLVEPWARGRGIGRQLVQGCIEFARTVGYPRIMLWTNSNLDAALHIYRAAGFQLLDEETHRSFGLDLVGQHWALQL